VCLPRLKVLVEGGAAARHVLPVEEVIPELPVPVLTVLPQRLGRLRMCRRISASNLRPTSGADGTGTLAGLRYQPWGRETSGWSMLWFVAQSASHSSRRT
jgi:hypothetical protein